MNDRIPGTTWSNPIWYRDKWRIYISGMDHPGLEYEYMHDDYDGDSDTENRAGHCESIEACKAEIDETVLTLAEYSKRIYTEKQHILDLLNSTNDLMETLSWAKPLPLDSRREPWHDPKAGDVPVQE